MANAPVAAAASAPTPAARAAAVAPEPGVTAVQGAYAQLADWTSTLGALGKLAEPIPYLQASAGAVAGFADLVDKAVTEQFAAATSWAELELDKTLDLGDGRTGKLTATPTPVADGKEIAVDLTIDRTLGGQRLAVTEGDSALTTSGGVEVAGHLTFSFVLHWQSADNTVYIVKDDARHTPALGMKITASATAAMSASVGILGVTAASVDASGNPRAASDPLLTMNLAATFTDPNNDGRLSSSELAVNGSAGGIVGVGFGTPAGSVDLHLKLTAAAAPGGIELPPVSGTVSVVCADLGSAGTSCPNPVTFALSGVGDFANMTPRDLADGLAQIVSAIDAVQRAQWPGSTSATELLGNIQLPFMKGTVADAVAVGEGLRQFLLDNVYPTVEQDPNADPATAGQPKFASIQGLIDLLGTVNLRIPGSTVQYGTVTLGIDGLEFDAAAHRLEFTLSLKRDAAAPIDLDAASTAATGIVKSATATTMTVAGTPWTVDQWAGRRVIAGNSGGYVQSNTADTITLTADWVGGNPAAGAVFALSGAEPNLGAASFADLLKAPGDDAKGHGIGKANAVNAVAKIAPSYRATLSLALDLRPGTCVNPDCSPKTVTDESGNSIVVTKTPIGPDRILLKTGTTLFDADLPITSTVDLQASAGFVGVHLTGNLAVCSSAADATCATTPAGAPKMLTVGLKKQGTDGWVTMGALFGKLTDLAHLSDLVDVTTNIRAYATVTAEVPQLAGFLTEPATATLTWANVPDTTTLNVDTSKLNPFAQLDFDPDNPRALFGTLVQLLRMLDQQLLDMDPNGAGAAVFSTTIPLVGKSFRDLLKSDESGDGPGTTYTTTSLVDPTKTFADALKGRTVVVGTQRAIVTGISDDRHTLTLGAPGFSTAPAKGTSYQFRSALEDALDAVTALNPDSLQGVLDVVNSKLGNTGLTFTFRPAAGGEPASIVAGFDWQRSYTVNTPLDVSMDLGGQQQELAGLKGSGSLEAAIKGHIKVGLVVPLNVLDPAATPQLKVLDNSSIGVSAKLGIGGSYQATLGPLSIALGKPGAAKDSADASQIKADYSLDLAQATPAATPTPITFDAFLSGLTGTVNSSSTAVSCAADPAAATISTELAMCGVLPVWVSANGTTYTPLYPSAADADKPDPDKGYFVLRLPKAGSDRFTPTGPLSATDATPRFVTPDPTQLLDQLKNALLDFSNLGVGLDTYLGLVENGMRTASADGKLPLVGSDLQQGADFVGTLRGQLQTEVWSKLPNNGDIPNAGELQSFLNQKLATAITLPGKYLHGSGLTITLTCTDGTTSAPCAASDPLTKVSGATVTFDVGAGKISTTQGCVDDADATIGNCYGTTIPVDLGIPGVSLKSGSGGGGDGISVKAGWRLHVKVGLDRSTGFYVATKDQTGVDAANNPVSLPELQVGLNLDVTAQSGTLLQARMGFLDVNVTNSPAHTAGTPLFAGAFGVDLKSTAGEASCFTGSGAGCAPDPNAKLTMAGLNAAAGASDLLAVSLTAKAKIDWTLAATADAALPGIKADFHLDWEFDNNAPSANADGLHIAFNNVRISSGQFFGKLLGPVVSQIKQLTGPLQPIIEQLYAPIPVLTDLSHLAGGPDITLLWIAKTFTTVAGGPKLDFVDKVLAVIKFANELPVGDDSVEIPIGSFSVVGTQALQTTATPDNAASLVSSPTLSPGDVKAALSNSATNSNKSSLTNGGSADKAGIAFPLLDKPSLAFGLLLGQDIDLVTFDSGPLSLGFSYRQVFGPVYAPPPVFITLSGSATITAHLRGGFDTFGIRKALDGAGAVSIIDGLYLATTDSSGKPLPVVSFRGELAAGAQVSAVIISVGVEGGVALTINLSWNDPNNDGKFRASEFAKAAFRNPLCLFTASGRVSIFLRVNITLGISPFSVSFSFTLADITLIDFSATPNCEPPPPRLAGTAGGTLVLYAGNLGDSTHRGDSTWSNHPEADKYLDETIKVTSLHDWTDPADPKFVGMAVEALGFRTEYKDASLQRVYLDGKGFKGAIKVSFTGDGPKSDSAAPPKGAQFDKDVIVFGGTGDDVINAGTGNTWIDGGAGADLIVGHDSPTAASGTKALVAGGPGDDSITVGNGDDTVAGDGSLAIGGTTGLTLNEPEGNRGITASVPVPAEIGAPSAAEGAGDGADRIALGLGKNTAFGNNGNDVVSVATDSQLPNNTLPNGGKAQKNVIVGGNGADRVSGGSGPDEIYTGAKGTFGVDAAGGSDTIPAGQPGNIVDTGSGSDTVYGSRAVDFVIGHSTAAQTLTVVGGGGNDVMVGGWGTDKLYGGPGDDYVVAEPSQIGDIDPAHPTDGGFGPLRAVVHQALPAGTVASSKTLVGGTGNDHIVGGDGGATIYGDRLLDPCSAVPDAAGNPTHVPPAETPNNPAIGDDGNDKVIGGNGIDVVSAGGGDDDLTLAGGADLACGQAGNDVIRGGDGPDAVKGGSGSDRLYGDAGDDWMFGNDGDDAAYGGSDDDTVEGNADNDYLSGDGGNDDVYGGTRTAGVADGKDIVNGGDGNDTLIGDNGSPRTAVLAPYPFDLAGTVPTAGAGDTVYGGNGNDTGYGGLGDDVMSGGNGDDRLEGNNGADRIGGDADEDIVIGGSSQSAASGVGRPDTGDTLSGGDGPDIVLGDNGVVESVATAADSTPVTRGRGFAGDYRVTLLDLGYAPTAGTSGADDLHGDAGPDVIFGQNGDDTAHGDAGDDYAEGGQGSDVVFGDSGDDDLVGGSSTPYTGEGAATVGQPDTGDTISGGDGEDLVLGDNGALVRGPGITASPLTVGRLTAPREIRVYDLGSNPHVGSGAADLVTGDAGNDVVLGQAGNDRLKGNANDDYVEGGPGIDWIEGNADDDDLVGGSSTIVTGAGADASGQPDTDDAIFGGGGDDVIAGDNALVLRDPAMPSTTATVRLGSTPGTAMTPRSVRLLDLQTGGSVLTGPPTERYGADRISGGSGVDVAYGQDGNDFISGGGGADHLEGNGGEDVIRGDLLLTADSTETAVVGLTADWPGASSAAGDLEGADQIAGQDDIIGGSSAPGFRDGDDVIEGDAGDDAILGDNGSLVRTLAGAAGELTENVYTERYLTGAVPADATVVRTHDPALPGDTTRFCTAAQATCEVAGAYGNDTLYGDGGNDGIWGQDGDDEIRGGDGNDDLFGELGNDTIFGDAGEDAVVGDRGGVMNRYLNAADVAELGFTVSTQNPPRESYTGFRAGSYDRRVDLLHDTDGQVWVAADMPHNGAGEGGDDKIRGGAGNDNLHGGFGDDLVNGDSGGDQVFGGDGADVMWGGAGCDPVADAATPDCLTGGTFDPSARGTDDRFVDHLFGGAGGTSQDSLDGILGADLLDWAPRGPQSGCVDARWPVTQQKGGVTNDPCVWYEMTSGNQHHQGIDWIYGGWDRDVMQADAAANGPNNGDRLIDWNGAYNLFSHCNAAYGGWNDIRQHSPQMQVFLTGLAWGSGAGRTADEVLTPGTSAFLELAYTYTTDNKDHGSGKAFPGTPGHFDDPVACAP